MIEGSEDMTNRDFFNSFLAYNPHDSVELKLRHYLGIEQDDYIWEKLVWLGLFEDKKIGLKMLLQHKCCKRFYKTNGLYLKMIKI